MKATVELIFMEMAEQLNNIQPHNILERAELSYKIVKQSATKLEDFIEKYKFTSTDGEVHYFKYIKPNILKERIYYTELYYLESLNRVVTKAPSSNTSKK